MTPEEAKKIIKQFRDRQGNSIDDIEALDMAIKALEQQNKSEIKIDCDNADCNNCVNHKYCDYEPNKSEILTGSESDDCISREAVKEMLTVEWTKYMPMELDMNLSFVLEKISELPSVTPKARWIPVSERLPEDLEPVNITWVNHEPEPYYHDIKDRNFVATGIYYRGQWYWYSTTCADYLGEYGSNEIDKVDDAVEIIAWMPLPESYRGDKDGNINNKE